MRGGYLKRNKLTIAGLASLLVLASCGPKTAALLSISAAPANVFLLTGGMQPLSVNVSYDNGTIQQVANWTCTSSNLAVAAVDSHGYIKGITAGSTNITIVYNEQGVSKTVMVPVQVETAPKAPAVHYVSE